MIDGVDQVKLSQQTEVRDYAKEFNDISTKINELVADGEAKQEIGAILQQNFSEGLNASNIGQFKAKIEDWFNKYYQNSETIPDEIKPLLDFLKGVGIDLNITKAPSETPVESTLKEPELGLKNLSLDGIEPTKGDEANSENQQGNYQFFSKIDKDIEGNGETRLGKTMAIISGLAESIGKIDITDEAASEELKKKINDIDGLLKNIQDVINNKSPDNVKKLQDYIYKNLESEADKKTFEQKNKFDPNTKEFDGKFGESTLEGLNKVLDKISQYIKEIPGYLNQVKEDVARKAEEEKKKNGKEKDSNEEEKDTEAEKQQKVNDVIEGLKLKELEMSDDDRKNYNLPEGVKIYEREGDSPKYYYIENNEFVVYVPVDTPQQTKRLDISKYEKGTDYSAAPRVDKTNNKQNAAENENETIDVANLLESAKSELGLIPAAGVDMADLGLPNDGLLFTSSLDSLLYYISPEGNRLLRLSPNFGGGRDYLNLNKYSQTKDIKNSWEKEDLLGYPPVTEEGRKYYDNILKSFVRRADKLKNSDCKIIIDYDSSDGMKKYKLDSYGFENFIEQDLLTTGWLYEGNDHLGRDLRIYNLISCLAREYKGKMKNCRFELVNGNELIRILSNGKREKVIGKREWENDYGKLPCDNSNNKAKRFADYLNKQCGGIYDPTLFIKPQTVPAAKPQTVPAAKPQTVPAAKPQTVPAAKPQTVPAANPHLNGGSSTIQETQVIGTQDTKLSTDTDITGHSSEVTGGGIGSSDTISSANPVESQVTVKPQVTTYSDEKSTPTKTDLLEVSSDLPEKLSNLKEIKNVCFSDRIQRSEPLLLKFKDLTLKTFNQAIDNVNNIEDADVKKQKIQVLNCFRDGFTKPNIKLLETGKNEACIYGLSSYGRFNESCLRGFALYFGINFGDEYLTLFQDIQSYEESISEEVLEQEAGNFFENLASKLISPMDKLKFEKTYRIHFVESYKKTKDPALHRYLKDSLRKSFDNMEKHLTWRVPIVGNDGATQYIDYNFTGKGINFNSTRPWPVGEGKVTFKMPGSRIEESFIGNWDKDSRLISCESYGEKIDIGYLGNAKMTPCFENDFSKLVIKGNGLANIGMLANRMNYITSKITSYQPENADIKRVSIMFGSLFVKLDGYMYDVKDNIRESMYIDDSMTNDEIESWFYRYLIEKRGH